MGGTGKATSELSRRTSTIQAKTSKSRQQCNLGGTAGRAGMRLFALKEQEWRGGVVVQERLTSSLAFLALFAAPSSLLLVFSHAMPSSIPFESTPPLYFTSKRTTNAKKLQRLVDPVHAAENCLNLHQGSLAADIENRDNIIELSRFHLEVNRSRRARPEVGHITKQAHRVGLTKQGCPSPYARGIRSLTPS